MCSASARRRNSASSSLSIRRYSGVSRALAFSAISVSVALASCHGVATVSEQKLAGESDDRQYAVCSDEQRGIVTLDLDFANPCRTTRHPVAGVGHPPVQLVELAVL